MKQSHLPFPAPVKSRKSKPEVHEAANLYAAEYYLKPERAREAEALTTKWARLFLARRLS